MSRKLFSRINLDVRKILAKEWLPQFFFFFFLSKKLEKRKHPMVGARLSKFWHIHKLDYHVAIKEIL